LPHPACSEQAQDFIIAQARAWFERHIDRRYFILLVAQIGGDQEFDDSNVAPGAIETGGLFVDADFAESGEADERAAGGVLDEDASLR
jgi:hypothetical protein